MSEPIILAFNLFPSQGDKIGNIVVGYGEIEYEWMLCLYSTIGDLDTAVRTMFRLKSESNRFEIGDALMRQAYAKQKLDKPYLQAFLAVSWCKKLRNQYAHCHWTATDDGLYFTTFEKAAETRDGGTKLQFAHIDEALLERQTNYFHFCLDLLRYLRHELDLRTERATENTFQRPKVLQAPPLHNPKSKSPPLRLS